VCVLGMRGIRGCTLSPSLSHTRSSTVPVVGGVTCTTHTHSLSHIHAHTLILSLSHTRTHTLILSLTHSTTCIHTQGETENALDTKRFTAFVAMLKKHQEWEGKAGWDTLRQTFPALGKEEELFVVRTHVSDSTKSLIPSGLCA
jgi:hypothetical protein